MSGWAAAASVFGDLAGPAIQYRWNRKLAKKEYPDTMQSMRDAGLNPILAGKLGGNSARQISQPQGIGRSAVGAANTTSLAKSQRDLMDKQQYAATQQGNYFKQLHIGQNIDNWQKGVQKDLQFRRLPGLRSVADMEGRSSSFLKTERGLSIMGNVLSGANSAKAIKSISK